DRAAWLLSTAAIACYMGGRVPLGHDTMVNAHALAKRAGGTTERIAGALLAGARLISGRDTGDGERELLDRWPEALDERVIMPGAPHLIGILHFLTWVERYDDADAFGAHVERMVAETGAVGALLLLRMGQLEVDFRRGDWAVARVRVSEALRLGEDTGQLIQRAPPLATLARLQAALGLEDECRATCAELLALALPAGLRSMTVYRESALGLLELGLGRARRAAEHLDTAARRCVEYGQLDPSVVLFHPDRIEAHIRAGDTDRAREALTEFALMAERTQRRWPLACVARCHGMLEDDFEPYFDRAYAYHRPDESPFELGRTELVHGERLRRARRLREARERLRSALAHFEHLGAAPWAARARAELRAAGGKARSARVSTIRELTPQELEVALAVARGATNREVAAALYVSPKTVEVHLSRTFRKLGVRSRTELANVLVGAR
ncbi:MAG TPA: helix-turn-helix transcriptional regulator, partial [Solirubrobacter sp.]